MHTAVVDFAGLGNATSSPLDSEILLSLEYLECDVDCRFWLESVSTRSFIKVADIPFLNRMRTIIGLEHSRILDCVVLSLEIIGSDMTRSLSGV